MKQWDIWTCDFADAGPHPAIIVSHPDRVARAPMVNALIGSSQRATRPPRENEVLLDAADGLDWETLVKCDLMYLIERERLYRASRLSRHSTTPGTGAPDQRLFRVHADLTIVIRSTQQRRANWASPSAALSESSGWPLPRFLAWTRSHSSAR